MVKTLSHRSIFKELKPYIIITLGLLIYSFAYTSILIPAQITGGGASGIGVIISHITNGSIPLGVSYLAINIVLLSIAVFIIGPKFGIKTIYAILVNSGILILMQQYIPYNILGLGQDALTSSILGGGLAGAGVAICFSQGGSSGGTDIIAMIVNKYFDISLGRVIMMVDVVIIGSSFFFFDGGITTVVYGYVTMAVIGYTIDLVMSGNKQSTQILVFSAKSEEIAKEIIETTERGVTLLDATGAYSGQAQKVAVVVCRKSETSEFYRIIKEVDPAAFITVASVMGVYGKGFESLRIKKKK